MNNKSKFLCGLMLTLALAGSAIAQANSVNDVIYINGIQNTEVDAALTRLKIEDRLNASPNHTGTAKKSFSVEVAWNPVGWFGNRPASLLGESFAEDEMEVFLLKTAEEKYRDDFKKISVPYNQSGVIDQDAAKRVKVYLDNILPGDNSIECVPSFFITCTGIGISAFGISADDMKPTQKVATDLAARVKALGSAIVIAHSEGNMLANLAYASIASEFGNDTTKMIRVINVANNSEFSVNGLDFTHTGDEALKKLEGLPSAGLNWYRTTPQCPDPKPAWKACNFVRSKQNFGDGVGGSYPYHDMVKIYLSTNTVPILDAQGVSFTPSAEQFRDRFEDFVYAAADSLSATGTTTATTNTIFSRPIIGDDIPLGSATNFYQYYFMGYASLGNPPNSPNYWVATQDFNKVRVKKIGGTATCADMSSTPALLGSANNGNSGLIDENGNAVASFTNGTAVGDYCDFQILLPGGMVSQGTHIAAIYFQAISNGSTVVLDGSSTNIGRSVNGWNSVDTAGGFAFQFCAGTCDGTFSTSRLNDTGITASQCYQAGSDTLVACNSAGAIALNNAQDGMTGRDANAATNSNTDGKLGFSFAAVTGGCVQDNVTGLMWEVKTTDGGLRDWNKTYTNYDSALSAQKWNGSSFFAPTQTEIDAATNSVGFKNSVNMQGLCGYGDWRLPAPGELQSIMDSSVFYPSPAIDATWFPNTQISTYWSSSPFVGDPSGYWAWKGGVFDGIDGRETSAYVRLVRAGQAQVQPRYTVSADGQEVTDNQTNLIWRRCAEGMNWDGTTCTGVGSNFTHEAALQRAAAQASSSTNTAWRLPNINELASIVDKSRFKPGIDPTAFPATPITTNWFWSASPSGDSRFARGVSDTIVGGDIRYRGGNVRLVRDGQ